MWFIAAADCVLLLHFAFVLFVIAGGVLALRWRRLAWVHVPVAVYGAVIEFVGFICPLTPLENWLRMRGGVAGYSGGFIAHYITAVMYPAGLTRHVQFVLGAGVLVLNAAVYTVWIRRGRRSLRRIVSGGQTGVDRAALDVALELGIPTGGWVPEGRLAEDGVIPDGYAGLRESDSADPAVRTRLNVRDSDATLLVSRGPLQGGSQLTLDEATRLGRPALHIDLATVARDEAVTRVRRWLREVGPATLNVAGPRASRDPTVGPAVLELLREVLRTRG